jgi:hypothetical protein
MNDPRQTLRAALDPRSVAIVGVSGNPNKIGGSRGHRIDNPERRRPVCGQREGVRRCAGRTVKLLRKGRNR